MTTTSKVRFDPSLSDVRVDIAVYQLPAELWDMAIDFLHDDKSSLKSCSLVCHSWLSSTRYHLFHAISPRRAEASLPQLRRFLASFALSALVTRQLSLREQPFLTIPNLRDVLLSLPSWTSWSSPAVLYCRTVPGIDSDQKKDFDPRHASFTSQSSAFYTATIRRKTSTRCSTSSLFLSSSISSN
ncbi:hypothetical protein OH76DRAFT_1359600 [Lentinus brumalis]|uniref:F-box domain-containing protein n=1 Tax=Lentinus brumalis TaxID=2498619 RepID=A0A371CW15_9APHY|nr:hypothetical protein OH76DRAFT_1359600 [Polyporus brumalis]